MFLSVGYRLTMFFTPIPVVWLIRITCPTVFDLILEANYNDSVNFLQQTLPFGVIFYNR